MCGIPKIPGEFKETIPKFLAVLVSPQVAPAAARGGINSHCAVHLGQIQGMGAGSENLARNRFSATAGGWKCRVESSHPAGVLLMSAPLLSPFHPLDTVTWFGQFTAPNSAPVGSPGGAGQCSALNYSRIYPFINSLGIYP